MSASSIHDIVRAYSNQARKKRRLDCFRANNGPPPLAFNRADCRNENTVCYGMIDNLNVQSHPESTDLETYGVAPVNIHCDHTLRRRSDGSIVGTLDKDMFDTFGKLAHECIEFQLSVAWLDGSATQRKKSVCQLEVIFYGPKNMADAVGLFMEECGYCLQDPCDCNRNVPYLNPQRLSSMFGEPPMTYDIQQPRRENGETLNKATIHALANFQTSEQLASAVTPSALATKLNPHQQQALNFFRRREMGLGQSDLDYGIWRAQSSPSHGSVFLNVVTDQKQSSMPPLWRGGILADEMGLGKTLSMIALIAGDKDVPFDDMHAITRTTPIVEIHSTLVIVPQNVLSSWEMQLKLHVVPESLTWMRHQGRSRIGVAPDANIPYIVLTTYQTVESEYRRSNRKKCALGSIKWKRIILDEAHIARNWKSSTAKAIAALSATSRWAVSGTPLQNGLLDLFGLFKFLQFTPYNDLGVFDKDIAELTRNKTLQESIERLRRLLSCVMIRRTKATVATMLPPRFERTIRLRFTPQEKAYYESIEQPSAELLGDEWDESQASGSIWLNVLQQIHSLRLVCNLGTAAAPSRPSLASPTLSNEDTASRMLSTQLVMSDGACQHCLTMLDLSELSSQPDNDGSGRAYYSTCYRLLCASCATLFNFETPISCDCESENMRCNLQPIPLLQLTSSSTLQSGSPTRDIENGTLEYISTKVFALLSDIIAHPDDKSVVFSFWTSSLDMVEKALQQRGVKYVRIDGKCSPSARIRALDQYRNDPDIEVMLITTSCGAVGIDLTAATRAYILEPQWNPTVEEQAMARIHRIGQTRPVTTIRYIMEDSIEEHIIDVVQDRKKHLVSLLLPPSAAHKASLDMK